MYRYICWLFIGLMTRGNVCAQMHPREGSELHYRIIEFSFPAMPRAGKYAIEIAKGNDTTESQFSKNIIRTIYSSVNNTVAEVPAFESMYTWRVTCADCKPVKTKSELHHFSTSVIPEVDPKMTRFRVLKPAVKFKDAFVFLDGTRALYDMSGNPVWFLPYIDGTQSPPADLKISPQGTITFLLNQKAYEINYDGEILWKGPNNGTVNGDTVEHYHHEFTRLANGHYMVLGNEYILDKRPLPRLMRNNMPEPPGGPGGPMRRDSANRISRRVPYGTLAEYDEKGNVVWSWLSSKYFIGSDVDNFKPEGGMFADIHENSFFFDEERKFIYVSCRNISRVIKISYPDGKVVSNYGEIYKPGVSPKGNSMFCGQHSCRVSEKGYLYLYNNNVCDTSSLPKVIIMKEPVTRDDTLARVWEYTCTMEGDGPKRFDGGGNVLELKDQSIFVSMNRPYSKIFIVNQAKEVLWSAIPEKWEGADSKWNMVPVYRGSIIEDRKTLEQLIRK